MLSDTHDLLRWKPNPKCFLQLFCTRILLFTLPNLCSSWQYLHFYLHYFLCLYCSVSTWFKTGLKEEIIPPCFWGPVVELTPPLQDLGFPYHSCSWMQLVMECRSNNLSMCFLSGTDRTSLNIFAKLQKWKEKLKKMVVSLSLLSR